MGGCRCTFRTCTVNTMKFPGMHFFHYPLKQEERLAEWIKYAQYPQIKQVPFSQAKNRVVCALHFRDECFMNYKKDRLVPQAVPTLDRLRNGMVLDYTQSDQPKATTLPPTTDKHLIPPKGYQPLGLPDDYFMEDVTNVEVLEEEDEPPEPPTKRSKKAQIKILNKDMCMDSSLSNGIPDNDDSTSISFSVDRYDEDDYGGKGELSVDSGATQSGMMINLSDIEFIQPEKEECHDPDNMISREVFEQTVDTFQAELLELKQESDKQKSEAEARIEKLELELAQAKKRIIAECNRSEAARSSSRNLQKKVEELEAANQQLSSRTTSPVQKPKAASATSGQLTKAQLFNGMRKYLTASMTSLVRMEVFGGPERKWKADEKQVCVELLRLGEKVYDYFHDEWRFRLPPKKLVKEWMNEEAEEDDEEDL